MNANTNTTTHARALVTAAKIEALANADAAMNNVSMPTYSELLLGMKKINDINGSTGGHAAMVDEFKHIARVLLAKAFA